MSIDPIPAPESTGLRAKDLRDKPCLIRPGKPGEVTGRDGEPWVFIDCTAILLNGKGIEERADGVRISWARALPQLEAAPGTWIACKPVEDKRAVVLEPLTGAERAVAERVLAELDDDADE
jgi:hypothetical protein